VRARFSAPIQTGPRALPASYTVGTGSFRGKVAGAWHWQPTQSSAEVKGRVELYLYSPTGPSWPVVGWPFPFLARQLCHRIPNSSLQGMDRKV